MLIEKSSLTSTGVGISDNLMPYVRCTGYTVILIDSMGLTVTDDPNIGEKVAVFKISKTKFWPKQNFF